MFVVGILKPLMVQLLMLFIILLIVLLIIIPSILILIDLYLILKIIKVIMIICRKLIFSISNDFFRFKWICLLQKLKVFSLLSSLKLNLVFLLMLVLGLFCNSSSFWLIKRSVFFSIVFLLISSLCNMTSINVKSFLRWTNFL